MNLTKLFRKGFSTAASERTPFIVEEGNECKVKIGVIGVSRKKITTCSGDIDTILY